MTDFAHITPTAYLDLFASGRPFHLTLAHLVEQDEAYASWYASRDTSRSIMPYINIMDNSAFEMYKQGRPMYETDKLIPMAEKIKADYVVMTDYPGEHYMNTVDKAIEMSKDLRNAGIGTFFVPQGEERDLAQLIDAFDWASEAPEVDYIGVSILAVPLAYGVEKGNKLQRFLSRWKFMCELEERGILTKIKENGKKIHFLGMVDGPNEISLVRDFHIDTWDSSAAVWAGLNSISFDDSPTGLINGKFEKHVDFESNFKDTSIAEANMKVIDDLVTRYNHTERL